MPRILIADDDPIFRPALQRNLVAEGFEIILAKDGKEAETLFRKQHSEIDLVISDIRMPEMDGVMLTRRIKGIRPVPVILMTGFSDILETIESYRLGADEFLAKPFERAALLNAIQRCLTTHGAPQIGTEEEDFCRMAINDFTSGRQIQFSIYIRLSDKKFVKIAHGGEDISTSQIRAYKAKGLHHLYLLHADFRKYVGFNLSTVRSLPDDRKQTREKKVTLLRQTGEILLSHVQHAGMDQESYESSVNFVQTVVDVLTEDANLVDILDALDKHDSQLYTHSVATSFYAVILAHALQWNLPTNRFKVGMGGLLHDVGQKEVNPVILKKSRGVWSSQELKAYENHPLLGVDILSQLNNIPMDVLEIVREHHEDCLAQGFPLGMRKTAIHPMAKLISVADQFCHRVLKAPHGTGLSPMDAIDQMMKVCSDRLDPQFFEALMRVFGFVPPSGYGRRHGVSIN